MKFPEPKTFRGAISPVTLLRWALGIGTFEYPTGRQRRAMSICWSGIYLIIFLYSVRLATLYNIWDSEGAAFTRTSYWIYVFAITMWGLAVIYVGQVKSKIVMESLCKVDKVNEMLNKLGIPNEYGLTFKSQIIHLIGTFFFLITMFAFLVMYFDNDDPIILIGCVYTGGYMSIVSFLEDYTFSTCIRYIGNRFRNLNMYLDELAIEDGNPKACFQDLNSHIPWLSPTELGHHLQSRCVVVADKRWMIRFLQNARKIHQDLCDIAMTLNEAFGVQILVSIALAITTITTVLFNTYNLCLMSTTPMNTSLQMRILSDLPWILFHSMKIFRIISTCSMTYTEAHQTGKRIHELIKPTTSIEIREELHAFSLQLMQNPLEFTAYGFFTLDYTMIRAMVGTLTTYSVFIIQMPHSFDRVNSSTTNAILPTIKPTIWNNRSDNFSGC